MAVRKAWKKEDLLCKVHLPEDMIPVYEAQARFAGIIYGRFLDKLSRGKIDKMAFSLLDDAAFEACFKLTKEEAASYEE